MTTDTVIIDGLHLSAFGLLRTGDPFLIADIINKYGINTNYFGVTASNAPLPSFVSSQSAVLVSAGTTGSAGFSMMRTHEYFTYQSGKGTRFKMSGMSSNLGSTGSLRQWGQFGDNDGIYFQHNRSEAGNYYDLCISSSSGQGALSVQQKNWNRSNYPELDPTKGNIFEVAYQWLGVGLVQFLINGKLVHVEEHANLLAGPYMRTAQLPLTVRVTDLGGSSASGWTLVCSSITVEGGSEPALWGFAAVKPGAPFALSTTETPLLTLRVTGSINGVDNRTQILPHHVTVAAGAFSGGADSATFKIYLNSTIVSSSFQSAATGSNAEVDYAAGSAGFVPGTLLDIAIISPAATIDKNLSDLFDLHSRKLLRRDHGSATKTVFYDSITITGKLNAGTGTGAVDLAWEESQ